jgi:hypothetical protein
LRIEIVASLVVDKLQAEVNSTVWGRNGDSVQSQRRVNCSKAPSLRQWQPFDLSAVSI